MHDSSFGNEPGHFLDCIRKRELIPFPKQEMKYTELLIIRISLGSAPSVM